MPSSCGGDEDRDDLWCGKPCSWLPTKLLWRLVLSRHCSCHVDECPILPLHNTILLWSVGGGEFVLDAFLLNVLLYLKVLKLRTVVTPYLFHP
jgi:hypothetical protein